MADDYLRLNLDDRRDALGAAAEASGRPPHLLEKDIWVVWALSALFSSPEGAHLVFKGGTSLSKVYRAISRFSEDVDLTYDIRALAPDLVKDAVDALPKSPSEQKRWSKEIRARLPEWIEARALPIIVEALKAHGLTATARAEGDKIFIEYDPLVRGPGYVRPRVMLEFGARSTGEPADFHDVTCDAAQHLEILSFPKARPRVMRAERTFWEKATAIHVFCAQGSFRGGAGFARHWHDIARLDDVGVCAAALKDRDLALAVAAHKAMFFAESASSGRIDYGAAVSGQLNLVPEGEARNVLAEDYRQMIDDGMFLGEVEPFEELLKSCQAIQDKANAACAEAAG